MLNYLLFSYPARCMQLILASHFFMRVQANIVPSIRSTLIQSRLVMALGKLLVTKFKRTSVYCETL